MRSSRSLLIALAAGSLAAGLSSCGAGSPAPAGSTAAPASTPSAGAVGPTQSVTQAGIGAITPSAGSGHDDEVKAFEDPAQAVAGTATVAGPAPRPGVVASLPAAAIPAIAGYRYVADVPGDPLADSLVTTRRSAFSGAVSRSVHEGSAAVGWVTVYRLTEPAGTDPLTDSVLVPAALGRFSGQELPVPSLVGDQRVQRVRHQGTQAVAWHAGPRIVVVWGAADDDAVMSFARQLIAATG